MYVPRHFKIVFFYCDLTHLLHIYVNKSFNKPKVTSISGRQPIKTRMRIKQYHIPITIEKVFDTGSVYHVLYIIKSIHFAPLIIQGDPNTIDFRYILIRRILLKTSQERVPFPHDRFRITITKKRRNVFLNVLTTYRQTLHA